MHEKQVFSVVIEKEDDWYVAVCSELDVASQGKTIDQALQNLQEAVSLYLEDSDVKKKLKNRQLTTPLVTTISV